jgi:hypothetical protein
MYNTLPTNSYFETPPQSLSRLYQDTQLYQPMAGTAVCHFIKVSSASLCPGAPTNYFCNLSRCVSLPKCNVGRSKPPLRKLFNISTLSVISIQYRPRLKSRSGSHNVRDSLKYFRKFNGVRVPQPIPHICRNITSLLGGRLMMFLFLCRNGSACKN